MTRRPLRPRIRPQDAKLVRGRVQARAAQLGLRCGTLLVLAAVLDLLLGWKRLRDDTVAIRHVAAKFPAGTRQLSATTIGRLLSRLDALEFIVYQPAHGRGHTAHIAIHPQFCTGVTELARDSRGRVIAEDLPSDPGPEKQAEAGENSSENVKFSADPFLIEEISPSTPLPPAADGPAEAPQPTRPTGVHVNPHAVRDVLAALPDCYRHAPARVRWGIGAAIKAQLARGWREDQIIDILARPLPGEVGKPLALARWRFAKNQGGPGPRLRPLQRAFDQAYDALQRACHTSQRDRDYAAVITEIGAVTAGRIADCAQRQASNAARGARVQPTTPQEVHAAHQGAVVHGARMARRAYPDQPMRAAVTAWLADHQPPPQPPPPPPAVALAPPARGFTVADLIAATPAGRCVKCQSVGAITRQDLPIPVPVCGDCWDAEASEGCDDAGVTVPVVEARNRPEARAAC
jgi:hypothetical protein